MFPTVDVRKNSLSVIDMITDLVPYRIDHDLTCEGAFDIYLGSHGKLLVICVAS